MEQVKNRLLLLVLVFVGLFVNAQENPTLDAYEGMPVKIHREKLYFGETYNAPGSHLLTDEELKTLLGTELFYQYDNARYLYRMGNTVKTIGWTTFGVGLGYAGLTYFVYDYIITRESLVRITLGAVVASLGVDMFTIGYIVRGNGKKKLEGIMGQYNIDKQKVAFHLSPSLMGCQLPQGQNPMALGMTFSVSF